MTTELVFDIESVGLPFESFDEVQQEYLLKFLAEAETPEARERKREEIIQGLNFNALTAQVVAIGMLNVRSQQGRVYYQASEKESWRDGRIEFESGSETEILQKFWEDVRPYRQFVTFNGRGFDCPFLMLRSAMLGIKPTRTLMPYRYSAQAHIDLLDQLTFYGAVRKFNLDFYCKAFGIESPKSHGITGAEVGALFAQGKHREIAQYCFDDVQATAELYRRWKDYLSFPSTG